MLRLFLKFLKNPVKFIRYSLLGRIKNNFLFLKYCKKNSLQEKEFIKKISRYKIKWDTNKKNIVLTQMVEDYSFCIKLSAAANHIATKHNANIGMYSVETRIEKGYYPNNFLWNNLFSFLFTEQLDRIYLAVGGKLLFRNSNIYSNQRKIKKIFSELKQQIKTKYDVLNITFEDIKVGDLIYDTYLRFANKTTVDVNDPFFDKILIQALNIYFVSKQNLEKNNIVALVNSYTTYTKHGIIVRLCLNKNIPVYIPLCGYISLVHKVSTSYPSHINNHFEYRNLFNALTNKNEIIEEHTKMFEKRFEGVIDGATSYMKESAFSDMINPELNYIDWSNTIVILAHCFFDSPHIYRDLIFPDFYEWIIFTLDELIKQKDLTILVKQHPNGLEQNNEIFEELKIKYKNSNVKFIDKKTSQLQIINSRPKAIITAYGTAASEFSYQGFPVLTIYDNPFTAFDFTHLAKTVDEYKSKLQSITKLEPKQNKKEIIEFYYMHNFFFLQGRSSDYLDFFKYKSNTFDDNFLKDYLPKMNEDYFNLLDNSIKDGLNLTEWESKICNN
jgi:hypothetical protein